MKIFMNLGCFFVLVATAPTAFAQNIATSNIRWNLQSAMDLNAGAMDQSPGYLITYKNDSVVWYTSTGQSKMKFDVTETDGSWTNTSNTGSYIYEIKYLSSHGNIRFFRSGASIEVRVVVPLSTGNLLTEFVVTNSTTTL